MNKSIDKDFDVTNLEAAIVDDLGKQMSDQIDFEIYAGLMCDLMGWVKVEINYNEWTEIDYWLEKNCKNEYKRNRHTIIFEDVQDANWCKLRWL